MLIRQALEAVAEFHRHIGEVVASAPNLLDGSPERAGRLAGELRSLGTGYRDCADPLIRRALLAIEELCEWLEAHQQESRVEALDAAADRLFVLLGDVVATGLPVEEAFRIVASSNLSKQAGQRSSAGKGIKAEGFEDPKRQLAQLLNGSETP